VGKYEVRPSRSGGITNARIDTALANDRQTIQKDADNFSFYPVLQLSLGCSC
jgi:hypothetical protein